MSVEKISLAAAKKNAVEGLSNHPGAASRYGTGGLSPTELKKRYDKMAWMLLEKLNELIDAINGEGGESPLLSQLKTAFADESDEQERRTLSAFLFEVAERLLLLERSEQRLLDMNRVVTGDVAALPWSGDSARYGEFSEDTNYGMAIAHLMRALLGALRSEGGDPAFSERVLAAIAALRQEKLDRQAAEHRLLPEVGEGDDGKELCVVRGAWAAMPRSEKAQIYGVSGIGKKSALARTDGAVGLTFQRSDRGRVIQSDFDTRYPWCDICEVTDPAGNVFVKIPKFYSRLTDRGEEGISLQISGKRHSGFTTLFRDGKGGELDYVLVGTYVGSSDSTPDGSAALCSKSGRAITRNINIGTARAQCRAWGEGYLQYDFLIHNILQQLFLVEFATEHTQSVMQGVSCGEEKPTGTTDGITTPSGQVSDDRNGDCRYRGIEGPWGNGCIFCDGLKTAIVAREGGGSATVIALCEDPALYGASYQPREALLPAGSGWVGLGAVGDLLYPARVLSTVGESTCRDYLWAIQRADQILYVGGAWRTDEQPGLFFYGLDYGNSAATATIGARLCYKPTGGGVL